MARTSAATVVHAAQTVVNAPGAPPCPVCCIAARFTWARSTNVADKPAEGLNAFRIRLATRPSAAAIKGFAGGANAAYQGQALRDFRRVPSAGHSFTVFAADDVYWQRIPDCRTRLRPLRPADR